MANGIQVPAASMDAPRATPSPQVNTYQPRVRPGGQIEGRFTGGPGFQADTSSGEGLAAFGRGLGAVGNALEVVVQRKQNIEAMANVNDFRDRERQALATMQEMKGRDGADAAYQYMMDFYDKEGPELLGKSRGLYQERYYASVLNQSRDSGLNTAMSHAIAQEDAWDASVVDGQMAGLFTGIDDDPYSWRNNLEAGFDIIDAANPGLDNTAKYRQLERDQGKRAINAAIARGDYAGAQALYDDASSGRRVSTLPPNVSVLADRMAAAQGVDPSLVRAVISVESNGKAGAVSKKGARGLMQLMPGTARDLGVNPDDPVQNVEGGTRYLAKMLQRANGNVRDALIMYNYGPGHYDDWAKRGGKFSQLPRETQEYVQKVMGQMRAGAGSQGRAAGGFVTPLAGNPRVSSGFGLRKAPETPKGRGSSDHQGIDYAVPTGTPVAASGAGRVTFVGDTGGGYGLQVKIDHGGGIETWYNHLSSAQGLESGATVDQGQQIALSGNSGKSTGPHLDFKVKVNGKFVNPEKFFAENAPQTQGQGPVMVASNAAAGPGTSMIDGSSQGPQDQEAMGFLVPSGDQFGMDTAQPATNWGSLFTPEESIEIQGAIDRAAAAALKQQDDMIKRMGVEVNKELTQMMYGVGGSQLTEQAIMERVDYLSRDDLDRYLKAVQEGPELPTKSDPETLIQARRMAVNGDAGLQDFLDDAFKNRLLTATDHGTVMNEGQQFRDPAIKMAERRIRDLTGASELNEDPAGRLSYSNAMADFWVWRDGKGRNADDKAILAEADRLGNNYRFIATKEVELTLPLPSDFVGTRLNMDIEATSQLIESRLNKGEITREQAAEDNKRLEEFEALKKKLTNGNSSGGSSAVDRGNNNGS
jgi:murein DD-endopeptidase MepM/ murein hydrolase activator NlpD